MLRHSPRAFVERLDFTTSLGDNLRVVITDLGILERRDGELDARRRPSGRGRRGRARRDRLGAPRRPTTSVETEPPTDEELTALRALKTKGRD